MIWPWQDGTQGFSWLKASTFVLMFVPAISLVHDVAAGEFGPVPLGGLTYWSGVWATAFLLLALAITPAVTIFRWRRLIVVRRMIGVTALAYTIAHIIIYFALRFWDFAFIANEIVTRLSMIVATVSTIGLIALGTTSVDAAVRRMGAKGWQQLHNTVYVVTVLALLHYLLSPGLFPDQFLMSGLSSGSWSGGRSTGVGREPVPGRWRCSPWLRVFSRRFWKSAGSGHSAATSCRRFSAFISPLFLASRRRGRYLRSDF